MSKEVYQQLLSDFQDLGCKSKGLFHIEIFAPGSSSTWNPPYDRDKYELLAEVRLPLDPNKEVDSSGENAKMNGWAVIKKSNGTAEERKELLQLMRKAGAALPPQIRDHLWGLCSWEMGDFASWWLALLVVLEGESAYSPDGQYVGKAWLMRPYLLCIDAIQRCQLDTDEPKFPMSPESSPAGEEAPPIQQQTDSGHDGPPRSKRSTERGEARAKIISTWTLHHKYGDGGILNYEPIGVGELARQAGVSPGSVTTFFDELFGGHPKYKSACHLEHTLLRASKEQNDDFSHELQYDPALLDEHEADRWDQREREGE